MFHAYVFNEMAYPFYPYENVRTMRTELPNSVMNPDVAHDLVHGYLDIWRNADELGLDIMLNEHHQTPSCLNSTMPLYLAIVARETKRARLLTLGAPIANRTDPVRTAEEMATIDVLSRGRLEMGLVVGAPHETQATNTNAANQRDRFWEATDLFVKALTTHDGPFNWEGKYFHHRQVNIWPRPYQEPCPPIWISTLSKKTIVQIAERDFSAGTVFIGTKGAKELFEAYRQRVTELDRRVNNDKLAYMAFVNVAETDEQAWQIGKKMPWFIYSQTSVPPQYASIPGYIPPEARAPGLRNQFLQMSGREDLIKGDAGGHELHKFAHAPIKDFIDRGMMLCGSPETVFQQMKALYENTGGFGNLMMMMATEHMGVDLVTDSMKLFAEQVLPRFIEEVYNKDPQRKPVYA